MNPPKSKVRAAVLVAAVVGVIALLMPFGSDGVATAEAPAPEGQSNVATMRAGYSTAYRPFFQAFPRHTTRSIRHAHHVPGES